MSRGLSVHVPPDRFSNRGLRATRIAVAMVMIAATRSSLAQSAQGPRHVVITGTDYAFLQLPDTLPSGPTALSFANRGKVKHEMSVVRLRPGVSVQQVLERGPGAASSRALVDQLIGILIARPGEDSGGELLVDLKPGRRYLVICTLRDAPDARQHMTLGMIGSFEAR